ncbi:hypothetical protein WN943_008688 [Citrus x changshan-huyou]
MGDVAAIYKWVHDNRMLLPTCCSIRKLKLPPNQFWRSAPASAHGTIAHHLLNTSSSRLPPPALPSVSVSPLESFNLGWSVFIFLFFYHN